MALEPHMPPQTARETLHALFGELHADCSVAGVEMLNLGVKVLCSCRARCWYVDNDRAVESGLTLSAVRHGFRNAPRRSLEESR